MIHILPWPEKKSERKANNNYGRRNHATCLPRFLLFFTSQFYDLPDSVGSEEKPKSRRLEVIVTMPRKCDRERDKGVPSVTLARRPHTPHSPRQTLSLSLHHRLSHCPVWTKRASQSQWHAHKPKTQMQYLQKINKTKERKPYHELRMDNAWKCRVQYPGPEEKGGDCSRVHRNHFPISLCFYLAYL